MNIKDNQINMLFLHVNLTRNQCYFYEHLVCQKVYRAAYYRSNNSNDYHV